MNKHPIWSCLLGVWLYVLAMPAFAHVKWFVEFDISDPPTAIQSLLINPVFWGLFGLALLGVVIGAYIDTVWSKKTFFSLWRWFPKDHKDLLINITRLGAGIFFVAIWIVGGVILTPELISDFPYLELIQLLTAFFLLFNVTLVLSAAGIVFLYAYGVYEYGLFHMLDYVFFVGLAIFLVAHQFSWWSRSKRLVLVTAFVSFAFMWSALEKIAYPMWFDPFLDQYPFLLMGFERNFFMLSAALVEFTLFYMLFVCRNGKPLIALAANLLIISGNIYFGKVDALGHFVANVLLVVIMLANHPFYQPDQVITWKRTTKITVGFILSAILLCAAYYGLHWYSYERLIPVGVS